MPLFTYTYTCACGLTHRVPDAAMHEARLWGSTRYAPRFTHLCPQCDRTNVVHGGRVIQSLQGGKRCPAPRKETPDAAA